MILKGWKDIAKYLGTAVRTVQRWELLGLPIRRPTPGRCRGGFDGGFGWMAQERAGGRRRSQTGQSRAIFSAISSLGF